MTGPPRKPNRHDVAVCRRRNRRARVRVARGPARAVRRRARARPARRRRLRRRRRHARAGHRGRLRRGRAARAEPRGAPSAWPAFADELRDRRRAELGVSRDGALVVAADRDDAEELRRLHELHAALGLAVAVARPARVPRARARPVAARARRDPRAARPPGRPGRDRARARAACRTRRRRAARARGGRRARAGGRKRDGCPHGDADVRAGTVVVAAGAWAAALAPDAPPVRPVKGQIASAARDRSGERARARRAHAALLHAGARRTAAWCSARRSRSGASTRP